MNGQQDLTHGARGVPFAGLVAPVAPLSEAIYKAVAELFAMPVRLTGAISLRRREARTVKALTALSDHMLRDVGIHRSEIADVAHYTVHHPGTDFRKRAL